MNCSMGVSGIFLVLARFRAVSTVGRSIGLGWPVEMRPGNVKIDLLWSAAC
jgi:hypothetical protein